jgi:hypothetical protein
MDLFEPQVTLKLDDHKLIVDQLESLVEYNILTLDDIIEKSELIKEDIFETLEQR